MKSFVCWSHGLQRFIVLHGECQPATAVRTYEDEDQQIMAQTVAATLNESPALAARELTLLVARVA